MNLTIRQIQEQLKQGATTCSALVEGSLRSIEAHQSLNAFLEVFADSARKQAAAVDEKIRTGTPLGELFGVTVAIKDNICYRGHRCSAASKILENFESIYSATVVERLLAADAIIVGRTNCDEFAMGSSNENSAYGPVHNAIDPNLVPGGSSGGSAVAVQAGMVQVSLGSDTGGSIRQPASFCNIVGLKPTYGRVSRWGLIAYASSFDQIGPFAQNVEDAALVLQVIAGRDAHDSTSSSKPVEPYGTLQPTARKLRIATFDSCIENKGNEPALRSGMRQLMEQLRADGHTVEAVEFSMLDYLIPCYYVLSTAEASSNLARFDGVHYGYRSPSAKDMEEVYKRSRSEGFGREVKNRIMLGTFVLSAGYYDAYYSRAQKVRRLLRDKLRAVFSSYDFVLLPTSPGAPFQFGAKTDDPVQMYLADIYTVLANLTGMPAISLPLLKNEDGLPLGVQLVADSFADKLLLDFSNELMQRYRP